jgi:hypothetical protein
MKRVRQLQLFAEYAEVADRPGLPVRTVRTLVAITMALDAKISRGPTTERVGPQVSEKTLDTGRGIS